MLQVNFCFETRKYSMPTAEGNSKGISQALQLTLALCIFKLVLYFNLVISGNQIKYYWPINREKLLQIQYGFYKHDLQIHYQLW